MTDKHLATMGDMTQSISIDPAALLTTSTINALHFPDLTTSGISMLVVVVEKALV